MLPPRVEGETQATADHVRQVIEQGIQTWGINLRNSKPGMRLVTNLTSGTNAHLILEALLLPDSGETPIFRKNYHAPRRFLDRMLTRLVDDLSQHVNGRRTPALSKMIAVREEGHGVSEIVLTDAAGSMVRPLTHHRSLSLYPTSVRNGRFAYVTYVSGPPEIWGMDLGNRKPRKLYSSPPGRGTPSHPTLSQDGKTLAFVESDKTGRTVIRLLDWDTGESKDLTQARAEFEAPSWSPNGQRLACLQKTTPTTSLVILTRTGAELQRYAIPGLIAETPAWNPSSDQIAFVAKGSGGASEIRTVDLSSGIAQTLFASESPISSPRWNPTLPWLAFARVRGGLQLLNVESRECHSVQGGSESHRSPRWVW